MRRSVLVGWLLTAVAVLLLCFAPEAEAARGRHWRRGIARSRGFLPRQDVVPKTPAPFRAQGGVSAFSTGTAIPDPSALVKSPSSYGGDPNGKVDSSDAFIACLEANGTVLIPDGHTYLLQAKVALEQYQSVRGEGWGSVVLIDSSLDEAAFSGVRHCEFSNFRIGRPDGTALNATAGSRAIEFDGDAGAGNSGFYLGFKIRNLHISGVETGIWLDFCGSGDVESNFVERCTTGLQLAGTQCNAIRVRGGEYRECVTGILHESDGIEVSFDGVTVEGNSVYGYRKTTNAQINTSFRNCYFEANDASDPGVTGYDIKVDAGIRNLSIVSCEFGGSPYGVHVTSCFYGIIDGCNFHTAEVKAIYLAGSSARFMRIGQNSYESGTATFDRTTDDVGRGTQFVGSNSPFQYGAYGDNSTDDTAALQDWIDANPAGGTLPNGTFIVGSPGLVLPTAYVLRGESWINSILKAKAAYAGPVITCANRNVITDLSITGAGVASSYGIDPGTALNVRLERCTVGGFPVGIQLDDAGNLNWVIRGCRIISNTTNGVLVSAAANGLVLENNFIDGNAIGVLVSGTVLQARIAGNYVSNSTTGGISVTASTRGIAVTSNFFTTNTTYDCSVTGNSRALLFTGNSCTGTETCFTTSAATGATIEGNTFSPSGGAAKSISITSVAATRNVIGQNVYLAGAFDLAADDSGLQTRYLGSFYANGIPTTGTWEKGEVVLNSALTTTNSTPKGWRCTTAGTMGSGGVFNAFFDGPQVITGTATWDPGNLAAGDSESTDVSVIGAGVGAVALAGHTSAIPAGFQISATVTSSSSVRVTLSNINGSTTDLLTGTVTVQVFQ